MAAQGFCQSFNSARSIARSEHTRYFVPFRDGACLYEFAHRAVSD
jgi:hypothetical protein